ncbi:MAG TPA: AMP-binding protein [Terriglobales bacterium]|nr:AMP-binding protein [Terriglobales bacterium]
MSVRQEQALAVEGLTIGTKDPANRPAPMTRRNLISLFDESTRFGRDVAVVEKRGYRRHSVTYAELMAWALFWSHGLAGRGIGPGDRVLLWGANSANWIACFWAILLRGAIVVPMDAGASHDFVERTIREAGVKLVLRDGVQPELAEGIPSVCYDDFTPIAQGPVPSQEDHPDPGDASTRETIAQILFTSGTTAEPRGVVLTHGNFLANLEPLEAGMQPYLKYERWMHPLRFVSLVPLSHVFGQFMTLFVPPLLGATVVFEPSNQHAEMIRAVKREKATALVAVPRMLDVLRSGMQREIETQGKLKKFTRRFEKAKDEEILRRAWRFRRIHRRFGWRFWAFISGGAALAGETELFFKRLGYAVVQGYGMTETASLISLNHPFRAAEGSVGKILPGREFKLAEDGEILVRGENVSAGYWERGGLRPAEEQGWLRTGDLGELDAEGNLRFRGRKKNVIVTAAGLNVYPEDLEGELRNRPGVRDCVVIPIERNGNAEPCVVLLLAGHEESLGKAVVEGANAGLAEYQKMRTWVVWPEPDFPRTPTGKARLGEIAKRTRELLGEQAEGVAQATGGADSLAEILSQFARGGGMASDAPLASLSSLDRVELLSALEQRYNVELSETAFAEARTVADVERLLEEPAAGPLRFVYPRWTQRTPVRWFRLLVYYALVWPATQILAHPRIVGREKLKNLKGPVIVVSNHITRRADIGLILAALPARFRHRLAATMGGETLQRMRKPPKEWFFAKRWAYRSGYVLVTALFNVFPLPQFSGFRESFRFAGETVDRGYSLLVFPEGVVNNSEDGRMAPFQTGIGLLAENLNLPIVPMRLDGVWQMKRERRRLAHLGEVTVHIGEPMEFSKESAPEEIAKALEQKILSL